MLKNLHNHNNLSTGCRNELYHESTGFTTNVLHFEIRNIRSWENILTIL